MTPRDQAQRWLTHCDIAVSGDNGHGQTFGVACALVNGFALSRPDAESLLREYSARCQPPWSDREIKHKLDSAESVTHDKPRGHMIRRGVRHIYRGLESDPAAPARREAKHERPVPKVAPSPNGGTGQAYVVPDECDLPGPMADGTRKLIEAAFKPKEGVRISVGRTRDDDGREVPKDEGLVLSREEWLRKLDAAAGNPNQFFRTADRNGIYVTINPMTDAGKADKDVTSYRHALIEFDNLSVNEQWSIICQSRMPCTAVVSSGGKSLHAWVRVDAQDRREYDDRVRILYAHFAEHQRPDEKNKNPSRFSRLAGCERGKQRQELLALTMGAESWIEWRADAEADGIGEVVTVESLLDFKTAEDPDSLIGKRWLCRGGSVLFVGQSGVGKSSLAVQQAMYWALGRSVFGIQPRRALKSLFIQAENDIGDLAEMVQGVVVGAQFADADKLAIGKNLVFVRDSTHTGFEFTEGIRRLIDKHRPDIVWLDPILSFIGDDISKQAVCSQFFRNWLGPISQATGVAWMIMHHTGKPPSDPRSRKGWTSTDLSYLGMGSSDITNWARAVCILQQVPTADGATAFELRLGKRGKRAEAKDANATTTTTSIWLQYAAEGIFWQQIDRPEMPEKRSKKGGDGTTAHSVGRAEQFVDFPADAFCESIRDEHLSYADVITRAAIFGCCSESTIKHKFWKTLKPLLDFEKEFKTYTFLG